MNKLTHFPRRGFVLIDAILGLSILASSAYFQTKVATEQSNKDSAKQLGVAMSQITRAIDRKVVIDGAASSSGWEFNTTGLEATLNTLQVELVGYENPDCGVDGGWAPEVTTFNRTALVSCDKLLVERLPFKLDLHSEATVRDVESGAIGYWRFFLTAPNDKALFDNFKYYQYIIDSYQIGSNFALSGTHSAALADIRSGNMVGVAHCVSIGSDCAIRFEYANTLEDENDSNYLRLDGGNAMLGDLLFETESGTPECFVRDADGTVVNSACGSILTESGTLTSALTLSSFLSSSSGFELVRANDQAARLCNVQGQLMNCGLMVVRKGSSDIGMLAVNEVHTDTVYADYLTVGGNLGQFVANGTGFSFSADGEQVITGNSAGAFGAKSLDIDNGKTSIKTYDWHMEIDTYPHFYREAYLYDGAIISGNVEIHNQVHMEDTLRVDKDAQFGNSVRIREGRNDGSVFDGDWVLRSASVVPTGRASGLKLEFKADGGDTYNGTPIFGVDRFIGTRDYESGGACGSANIGTIGRCDYSELCICRGWSQSPKWHKFGYAD